MGVGEGDGRVEKGARKGGYRVESLAGHVPPVTPRSRGSDQAGDGWRKEGKGKEGCGKEGGMEGHRSEWREVKVTCARTLLGEEGEMRKK